MIRKNTGRYVKCTLCGDEIYRMPSRIYKLNFCKPAHYRDYLSSSSNTTLCKGWKHTKEAIEKIRQANLNRDYNVIFTKETRLKLAEGAKNKIWTESAREKLRKANLGKKLTEETRQKIRQNAKYGWKNKAWKGRHSSYVAKHIWAKKYYTGLWECALRDAGLGSCDGRLELSNKNHKYLKRLEDWWVLCKLHHDLYDFRYGIRGITNKIRRMYERFGPVHLRDLTIDGIVVKTPSTTPQNAI